MTLVQQRGRALADGLVFVSEQQKMRTWEVMRQYHELRDGVVLDLVNHR